jgi:hypothetical protein
MPSIGIGRQPSKDFFKLLAGPFELYCSGFHFDDPFESALEKAEVVSIWNKGEFREEEKFPWGVSCSKSMPLGG